MKAKRQNRSGEIQLRSWTELGGTSPAVPLAGETELILGTVGLKRTVIDVLAEIEATVAVMVALLAVGPPVTCLCDPDALLTVALFVFEELHVAVAVTSCVLPSENVPVAVSCTFDPT